MSHSKPLLELTQKHSTSLRSHACQGDDLHDIRLGVRTAGAIDLALSDLGKDNLHGKNPQTTSDRKPDVHHRFARCQALRRQPFIGMREKISDCVNAPLFQILVRAGIEEQTRDGL